MKKKKKPIFRNICVLTFLSFSILYFMKINGYYDYHNYNDMTITKEAMERFEQDVSNGNDISIDEYLTSSNKDYQNIFTNIGVKTGSVIESAVRVSIEKTFRLLESFLIS